MNLFKHLRLLPAVVVVGLGLLAIKGVDIARAAQNISDADQEDNSGLAPASPAAKAAPDLADDDAATGSAGEADVLTSLTKRRAELDARERALTMRENMLGAGEARVDQKIAALKDLQGQIQTLLGERDTRQDAQIASLVKTYSAMKPKDAARIFNTLSDDVLIPVAKGMKSDVLAPVMAAMNPDAAQKLTVKLAALLKLPETAPEALCPTPAATSADATATPPAATPVVTPLANPASPPVTPLQTAAVTPPAAPAPKPDKPAPKPVVAKPVAAATPPAAKPTTTPASAPAATAAPTPLNPPTK